MKIAELKIKVVSLALEGATIHRDETVHRERARVFERYGRAPKLVRRIPDTLEGDARACAVAGDLHAYDVRQKNDRLYGWLASLPEGKGAEVATRQGLAARAAWSSLRDHRKGPLRTTARTTLLAYAFLRGIPYAGRPGEKCRSIEAPNSSDPDWQAVLDTAVRFRSVPTDARFGPGDDPHAMGEAFRAWMGAAAVFLAAGRKKAAEVAKEVAHRRAVATAHHQGA